MEVRQRDALPVRGRLGLPRPKLQSQPWNPWPRRTDTGARHAWGPVLCIPACGERWFHGGLASYPVGSWLTRSAEACPLAFFSGHVCHHECPEGSGSVPKTSQDTRATPGALRTRGLPRGGPTTGPFPGLCSRARLRRARGIQHHHSRPRAPWPLPSAGLRALSTCRGQLPSLPRVCKSPLFFP